MSPASAAGRDRLALWCGWVMVGLAVLTAPFGWLFYQGFSVLIALVGLLCLPALRINEGDRPVAVVLLAALAWAAISTIWSPHHPPLDANQGLKLTAELVLYWSAWCAARRADPRLAGLALRILAWSLGLLGAWLTVEAFTWGAVYHALRNALYEPTRIDLSLKSLAEAAYPLALLWPVAAAGGVRAGAPQWLAIPMVIGTFALGLQLGSDAQVVAVFVSLIVGGVVLAWPRGGPKALALTAAAYFLLAPAIVLGVRSVTRGVPGGLQVQESWSMRLGYWSNTVDAIAEKPLLGWGLDASRTFSGVGLHPHNGALQAWLELGALGAAAAALFWAMSLRRLSREGRDLMAAAIAASAGLYLLFEAVGHGIWQEHWLAMGALAAIVGVLGSGPLAPWSTRPNRRSAAKSST